MAFSWRHVLFANWPIDSTSLTEHLPPRLTVDKYDGKGWLTVVSLLNVNTRPRGLPPQLGVNLPQLNLRTYVTCNDDPGIYFFSIEAPSLLIALGTRLTHQLPYYYAKIRLETTNDNVYLWSRRRHPGARPAYYEVTYSRIGDPFEAERGTFAEFVTERRRLYTLSQEENLRYTDVSHGRWTLYETTTDIARNTLFRANGLPVLTEKPVCYYSPGLDVVTSRSKRWDREA